MKILSTKNYDMFKLTDLNRYKGVTESHVKAIMKSIIECNLLHVRPILVGKDNVVIDGQHRLEAAKRLGVPIYYSVHEDLGEEDLLPLTAGNLKWSCEDYLNYYAKKGCESSKLILDLGKKTGYSCTFLLKITGKSGGSLFKMIKDNKPINFPDNFEEKFMNFFDFYKGVYDIVVANFGFNIKLKSSSFMSALWTLYNLDEMIPEVFFKNLSLCSSWFGYKIDRKSYLQMFLKIYNYKRKTKLLSMSNEE